jgi:hypothetical protein
VIQLGNEAPLCGAVEVDPVGADWRAHGHAGNPEFTEVILHVIWNGPAHTALPTLLLQPYLNAPWAELAEELAAERLACSPMSCAVKRSPPKNVCPRFGIIGGVNERH